MAHTTGAAGVVVVAADVGGIKDEDDDDDSWVILRFAKKRNGLLIDRIESKSDGIIGGSSWLSRGATTTQRCSSAANGFRGVTVDGFRIRIIIGGVRNTVLVVPSVIAAGAAAAATATSSSSLRFIVPKARLQGLIHVIVVNVVVCVFGAHANRRGSNFMAVFNSSTVLAIKLSCWHDNAGTNAGEWLALEKRIPSVTSCVPARA
jgi:hypothetical protein